MISLHAQGGNTQKQAVTSPSSQRIVPKPTPETQTRDPRGYQIEQIRRRYSPRENTLSDGTTSLSFRLKPSDPDFAFELEHLQCDLRVPKDYPEEAPVLHVKNNDIPRGFSINVERGWQKLASEKRGATLLSLTYALDKNLEAFLSTEKVDTVTLMSFKDTRHLNAAAPSSVTPTAQAPAASVPAQPNKPKPLPSREPSFTRDQIAEAKARRAQETRQLETRMGRLSLYRRSADGIVYTLPLEPRRRAELPPGLQGVKTMHVIVPLMYPLQQLRFQLNEVDSNEAEPLEEIFVQKAADQKHLTLISHLNYLSQNMHILARQAQVQTQAQARERAEAAATQQAASASTEPEKVSSGKQPELILEDRGHVKVIARPPEWAAYSSDGNSSSEEYDLDSDEGPETGGAALDVAPPGLSSGLTAERGIAINFPGIELHSIELLQVTILSISVKCERCRTINDMTSLQGEKEKTISCRKCAAGIAARFRPQLIHQASPRAGFLDLAGATVADMLPSTFVPVCAKCSTASPGLVSVRGETTTNVCRDCHAKFTFHVADVRFLPYAPGNLAAPAAGNSRRQERLGLHAGEPLPERGACAHYRKSFRWFRFSCCNRVYPCDRCHDESEEHVNEWASRMVCGWCSREQRYAVEACGFCGRSVIGRKGRGFWEGGKGTRDKKLMSKKDPRKYKRIGASEGKKD